MSFASSGPLAPAQGGEYTNVAYTLLDPGRDIVVRALVRDVEMALAPPQGKLTAQEPFVVASMSLGGADITEERFLWEVIVVDLRDGCRRGKWGG